ncbi:hypothetical protein ACEQ8H_003922 [Pleosporales sp. CAS-2024a]
MMHTSKTQDCSLTCYKLHKTSHPEPSTAPNPTLVQATLPQPPPPARLPRYLKKKADFSVLATSPKFQDLLQTYPTLLPTLQRVYAATIEPDPEDDKRRRGGGSRGRGSRGRGRGRFRGGFDHGDGKWTQKKGDVDGMRILEGLRQGHGDEGLKAFVALVEETVANSNHKAQGD